MNFNDQYIDLEFFRQLVKALPGHVYWKDTQGRYLGCNEAQAAAFQLNSTEEVINTTDYDYFSKEDADRLFYNDQHVIASKQLQTIEETGAFPGQTKSTYLSKKIPLKNKQNEVIGILGVSFDITDRKQTEEKMQQAKESAEHINQLNHHFLAQLVEEVTGQKVSEQQTPIKSAEEMRDYFESLLAVMPGHVYWKNRDNVYLGCNNLQAEHAGLSSRKDIIGRKLEELFPRSIADPIVAIDAQVMEIGKSTITEEYVEMESGPECYLSHKVPLRDKDNEIIGMLGVSIDISARKEAEEYLKKAKQHAEEASHAKSQFIANMSHDIRTPLTGLLGMAENLLNRVENKEDQELASHILHSGKRLSRLLNEILEVSVLDASKQRVKLSTLNFKNLLQDVIGLMSEESTQRGNQVMLRCGSQLPEYIMTDNMRIHRILLNLIGNALRFTNNGNVFVDVDVANSANPTLQMVVKDTGIGIPSDKLDKIFDPFFKISTSYNENLSGVGLGLHIVKQFVTDLDGDIVVDSALGEGAEFTVLLPLQLPSEDEIAILMQTQSKVVSTKSSQPLKILLIEDDEICQQAAQIMLIDLNHQVDVANSGAEALSKLDNKYDLILMDIGLPDVDGMTLAKQIRSQAGVNQDTLIMALTAHVSQQNKEQFLDAGMNAVLFKPFSGEELKKVLNHL